MSFKLALNFSDDRTYFVDATSNETVVDAALRHNIMLPVDCREGVCGTCRAQCVSGDYRLDYVHPETVSQDDLAGGAVLCCQMYAKTDCVIHFDLDSSLVASRAQNAPSALKKAIVRQITHVSDAVAILDMELEAGGTLDYLPGQYAHLQVPDTKVWRSYSFATAPATGFLRFIIRLLPSGEMSDYLRTRARIGDVLDMEGPFGVFYLRRLTRPVLFVAGGTGISAFLGMLDTLRGVDQPAHPITLLYGVTHSQDFCEMERLQAFSAAIPGFRFRTIAVNAAPEWTGRRGVVTDLLQDDDFHVDGTDMYICGPPPMVNAVQDIIRQKGLANVHLYTEKFAASLIRPGS